MLSSDEGIKVQNSEVIPQDHRTSRLTAHLPDTFRVLGMCYLYHAVFFMPLKPNKCPLGLVFLPEVAEMGAWEELRRRSLDPLTGPPPLPRASPKGQTFRAPQGGSTPKSRSADSLRASAGKKEEPASLLRTHCTVQGSDKGLSYLFSLMTTGIIQRGDSGRERQGEGIE